MTCSKDNHEYMVNIEWQDWRRRVIVRCARDGCRYYFDAGKAKRRTIRELWKAITSFIVVE